MLSIFLGYRFGNWLQLFPQGNTLGITRGKPIPNGQTIKENLTVFQKPADND